MRLFRSLMVGAILLATPVVFAQDVATPPGTLVTFISGQSPDPADDELQIAATSGVLVGVSAWNKNTSADAWLKCTNATAANTTPGSTAIYYRMMIPFGSGYIEPVNTSFSTALTCYLSLGSADSNVDDVATGEVGYNLKYRLN